MLGYYSKKYNFLKKKGPATLYNNSFTVNTQRKFDVNNCLYGNG